MIDVIKEKKKTGPKGPWKWTDEAIEIEAEELLKYMNTASVPFLKDFCYQRGYPSQNITDCFIKNEKFSDAYNRFKDKQESFLVSGALQNDLNGWFSFQTLKNVAGWRDRTEVEHSGEVKHVLADKIKEARERAVNRVTHNVESHN